MIQPFGQREYKAPETEILPLTAEALNYLTNVRKLEKDTIAAYQLGCNKYGEIVIPFFDDSGKLVLVKRRHARGEMLQRKRKMDDGTFEPYTVKTDIEKGGKPVLLGSNLCDSKEGALIVCFGDYDAMAASQCGIPNCVSLPFGDGGFQFFETQWDFIEKFSEIILFPDNDKYPTVEAEKKALKKLDELAMRFGKHRTKIVDKRFYYGAKDANELLINKGKEACLFAINNAEWFPSGIVSVATYQEPEMQAGVPIRLPDVDKSTAGFGAGDLVLIGGDNGAGKTTEALNIAAEFIEQNYSVFLWSGEQRVGKIRYWIERILCGPENLQMQTEKETGFEFFFPLEEEKPFLRHWYETHLFQLPNLAIEPQEFFESAQLAVRRHGCQLIIVDNLMSFTGGEGEGYYQAQGDFAQSCKMFADTWGVTVLLLVHNKKEQEGKLPTKDSIEGSRKISNWADIILQMWRVPETSKQDWGNADTILRVCKSRNSGILVDIRLAFDAISNRFCQKSEDWKLGKSFGWRELLKYGE